MYASAFRVYFSVLFTFQILHHSSFDLQNLTFFIRNNKINSLNISRFSQNNSQKTHKTSRGTHNTHPLFYSHTSYATKHGRKSLESLYSSYNNMNKSLLSTVSSFASHKKGVDYYLNNNRHYTLRKIHISLLLLEKYVHIRCIE